MSKVIDCFKGEHHWLSNFYSCPVHFEGLTFKNSEAAFQAAKTLNMDEREKFVGLSPLIAKRKGRRVKLRSDWEDVKIVVMRNVLRCKFSQNPELKAKLIATGDSKLEEGNNHGDRTWGVCSKTNTGKNLLGKILMEIRAELMN